MDKQTFLNELKKRFTESGMEAAEVEKYISRFTSLIESAGGDRAQAEKIAELGSPKDIADGIINLKSTNSAQAQEKGGSAAKSARRAVSPNAQQDAKSDNSAGSPEDEADDGSTIVIGGQRKPSRGASSLSQETPKKASTQRAESESSYENDNAALNKAAIRNPTAPSVRASQDPSVQQRQLQKKDSQAVAKKPSQASRQITVDSVDDYTPPMSKRGLSVFWWGAVISSPVWLFLLAVAAFVIAVLYGAILFISMALVVAEVIIVIAGTLLALIGIVYGVIMLLPGSSQPYVGLFELGLGIIIGGITLVLGSLIYTILVSGFPAGMKLITRLARFLVKSIKKLVLYIRKECGKL